MSITAQGNPPLVSASYCMKEEGPTMRRSLSESEPFDIQWHTNQPKLCLIRSILLIYLCIRFTLILLFVFLSFFPSKQQTLVKRQSGSIPSFDGGHPHCVPPKGDVRKHPTWKTHILRAKGAYPHPGSIGSTRSTSPTLKNASPCNTDKYI